VDQGARRRLRLCFFGTYPRSYTVSRILHAAAEAAGFEIVECHEPLWERVPVKTPPYFRGRSTIAHASAYVRAALRLARKYRERGVACDVLLVGFRGQFDILLLRLLRPRKPVIFAPLVSLKETLVEDRSAFSQNSLAARALASLDRRSLAAATRVLVDTREHAKYLEREFSLSSARAAVFYLGADCSAFQPVRPRQPDGHVKVLFFGSFLPLHGVQTILEAAERIQTSGGIELTLCGDGWEYRERQAWAAERRLRNVRFVPWVEYPRLQSLIAGHDLCLGIFGTNTKAQMVIPNKVYQCAAVGRPVITADTPAIREVFEPGTTIWLVPPGDAKALADAIALLAEDVCLRERLARQAARFMAEQFSLARQAERLRDLVEGVAEHD